MRRWWQSALGRGLIFVGMAQCALLWPLRPALAHALPVSYSPAPNAALSTPPSTVQIRFSEQLNSDISKIVVVNPANQEVDDKDSQVAPDGVTMTVTLPLLPAGTYVVAWRTHSADDGHVAEGSYLFHIKRADGTVPPITGPLPSGNIIGGGGNATTPLDGPTLLQTIAHWVALTGLIVLLGIIFWWWFIMPRQTALSAELAQTISQRSGQVADLALEAILGGTILEIVLQALILNGSAAGIFSVPLLSSILRSRQGTFLLLRLGLSLGGLVCLWVPQLRTALRPANLRWVLPIFGVVLALGFVYSGHGGAASQWWGAPNDALHLVADGIWVGGLLTLALVVLPALLARPQAERAAFFARNLPAFSIPALVAVVFISITGPLNADTRMTSFSQLWTTAYGVVLSIKIVIFVAMVGVSYYHAFRLRPRLAGALGQAAPTPTRQGMGTVAMLQQRAFALLTPITAAPDGTLAVGERAEIASSQTETVENLTRQMPFWLRLEATMGLAVIFCAALLAPLAGTLTPTITSANSSFGAVGGTQTGTLTVDNLSVTYVLSPGKVGSNQLTLTIKNPDGTLASGGTVFVLSEMVEMDMGINNFNLTAGSAPGTYQGNIDLLMAGHWKITAVIRTKAEPNTLHRTTFTVGASF